MGLLPRIPLFEDRRRIPIWINTTPDRIPPSARFDRLEIDTRPLLREVVLVNQCLPGSCTALTSLIIFGNPDRKS